MGLMGVARPGICEGDYVAIWLGSSVPFIVRPSPPSTEDGLGCTIVNTAYVGGIMEGLFVERLYYPGLVKTQRFYVKYSLDVRDLEHHKEMTIDSSLKNLSPPRRSTPTALQTSTFSKLVPKQYSHHMYTQ